MVAAGAAGVRGHRARRRDPGGARPTCPRSPCATSRCCRAAARCSSTCSTNDSDPSGGILVVQSVTVEPNSGISVAVLNHETLRISDQAALSEQVRISLPHLERLAVGRRRGHRHPDPRARAAAPAGRERRPGRGACGRRRDDPGARQRLPPERRRDPCRPRPHPAADRPRGRRGLRLAGHRALPGVGRARHRLRHVRGRRQHRAEGCRLHHDPGAAGQRRDQCRSAPARHHRSRARRHAGCASRCRSTASTPTATRSSWSASPRSPSKGRVTEIGSDYLVYEAFDDTAGVDTFTYRVRDRLGAEATATIRVGIAPAEGVNQAPYAVKDAVVMRPDRSVAVPVLANDSDPDGDEFGDRQERAHPARRRRPRGEGRRRPRRRDLARRSRSRRRCSTRSATRAAPRRRPCCRSRWPRTCRSSADRARRLRAAPRTSRTASSTSRCSPTTRTPTAPSTTSSCRSPTRDSRVLSDGRVRITLGDADRLATYTITDRDGNAASAFIHVPALVVAAADARLDRGRSRSRAARPSSCRSPTTSARRAAARSSSPRPPRSPRCTTTDRRWSRTRRRSSTRRRRATSAPTRSRSRSPTAPAPTIPKGRKATLTLPITVLPPENQQPIFVNGQMDVAPGEDPTSSRPRRSHRPIPTPRTPTGLEFEIVGGSPDGMTASIDGDELRVSAAAETKKGTAATLRLRITDGDHRAHRGHRDGRA